MVLLCVGMGGIGINVIVSIGIGIGAYIMGQNFSLFHCILFWHYFIINGIYLVMVGFMVFVWLVMVGRLVWDGRTRLSRSR